MTPLAVARQMVRIDSERDSDDWNCPESQGWQEVIAFLEHCSRPAKRARNSMSMEERAAQVGVLNRLKPIPETLRASAAKGSEDAKRQLQKLQTAKTSKLCHERRSKQRRSKSKSFKTVVSVFSCAVRCGLFLYNPHRFRS